MVWRAGVIVTASHLLRRGEGIELTFAQRDGVKASLAGRDPGTDLAVLQFEEASLAPAVQTAKTSDLRVGQLVLAVGRSKLGDLAAAAGIVARLGGAWQTWRGGRIDSLLRPDLTLHPGQSGSALVDSRGFVLGMNTSTLARASTITIPTATVDRVLDEILQHGGVFRPYLGLAMQAVALPPEIGGKTGRGLMVMQVEPESPAAASGISLGDIILGVEGDHIGGVEDLQRVLGAKKRGDSVELKYARAGKPATANVKLADRPRR
jgi:S1-C subfamily serine protease